jgi:hypothetical protein
VPNPVPARGEIPPALRGFGVFPFTRKNTAQNCSVFSWLPLVGVLRNYNSFIVENDFLKSLSSTDMSVSVLEQID